MSDVPSIPVSDLAGPMPTVVRQRKVDPRKYPAYMICDAGRGKNRRADRTSIPVFTAGPERRVFLVDWVWDRMEPDERTDAICRLIRRWKPVRFIYEEYGLVSDTFYLSERFQREGIDLIPTPVGRKGSRSQISKHDRILQLQPWFREGRIWLPRRLMYTGVDGTTVDLISRFINEEYIPYRGPDTVPHDDGLDSFSRLNEPELCLEYAEIAVERDEDDGSESSIGHGSWEAVYG